MFTKPNPKPSFFELETQILKWWKETKNLEKTIENRPPDKLWSIYDGPITANGQPHHGHMLTFASKDLLPRFWSMKGYRVSRSLGWDCQGIPVEYEIEKKLGFKEKKDIEKYGIEKFNQLCRESVLEYKENIQDLEEMMGRLTNNEEEYSTMDKDYIESIWWSLKELHTKGLLYEGFKVVPYSTRAGTTLSNAEVALGGYKKIVDPAITVAFELESEKGTFLLAWTTTPWTIPGNLGLAVGKDIIYVKVKPEGSEKQYILAKERLEYVFGNKPYSVSEELSSVDLVGKKYIPPYPIFVGRKNTHEIHEGNFVTTDSGTGVVHLAPYGAEDNELFQNKGIESFDYLDEQGHFNEIVPQYAGMHYKSANNEIVNFLKETKAIEVKDVEEYEHDMPMCWRTNTPLIYKPITSWYIAMSTLREKLVGLNNTINWVPEHAKEGRFGNWLSEIKDWGISRLRYWGTPIPVWKSENGKVIIIGSYSELEELSGVKLEDPHRPFVDDITFEKDGEKYSRIKDVLDVWYDSGAMPFARFHYPFENKDKFNNKFPSDYISESVDQTRGWFYTLHALSTALFDSVSFKNVVMTGFVLDDQGVKLSKSKKNYTEPRPMIHNFGADTIRLNFFNTPICAGEDTTISDKTLRIQQQEYMIPLWNIFSYLVTYANLHNWKPDSSLAYNLRKNTKDTHPWNHIPFDDVTDSRDAWIILKLQLAIKNVNKYLENFSFPKATATLKELLDDVSKWFIRVSRDSFVEGDLTKISTLYYVLIEFLKLSAPFTPFISEYLYKELTVNFNLATPESIHLTDYPEADEEYTKQYFAIQAEMDVVMKICEMGHKLRAESGIKVRQPLSELQLSLTSVTVPELSDWMINLIKKELNVKSVSEKFKIDDLETIPQSTDGATGVSIGLNIELTQELTFEGNMRELVRTIQDSRKKLNLSVNDEISAEVYISSLEFRKFVEDNLSNLLKSVRASSINISKHIFESESQIDFGDSKVIVKINK